MTRYPKKLGHTGFHILKINLFALFLLFWLKLVKECQKSLNKKSSFNQCTALFHQKCFIVSVPRSYGCSGPSQTCNACSRSPPISEESSDHRILDDFDAVKFERHLEWRIVFSKTIFPDVKTTLTKFPKFGSPIQIKFSVTCNLPQ